MSADDLNLRSRSLFEIVAAHARRDPTAPALLTEQDGQVRYGELVDRSARLATSLRDALGLRPGARVALWLDNRPAWVEAYLACNASAIGTVGFNPSWTVAEAIVAAGISEVEAIVCAAEDAERAEAVARAEPSIRHVIVVAEQVASADPKVVHLEDLIVARPSPSSGAPGGGRAEHIVFTSGTTAGRPKAVRTRPRLGGGVDYRELIGVNPADRALVVTPFFHVNGLGALLSALQNGASAVFPRRFSASRFWSLVAEHEPTYLMTLAPIVHIVLGRGPSPLERAHRLRVAIVPGAGADIERMEERLGVPILEWYGMTEATGSGTCTRLGEHRPLGTAGRRLAGSTMTVLRDDGTIAAPNEVGEVVFERGSIVFRDYLNDPEATAAVLDGDWFRTGDLGYFDDHGYFFFVDRTKDIIRRGGENISSVEVEEALRRVPGVADAAVVARPDPVLGERVAAFVVVPGADLDGAEVRDALVGSVAAFKIPDEVVVVDDLPRTDTGKVHKALLREQLLRSA